MSRAAPRLAATHRRWYGFTETPDRAGPAVSNGSPDEEEANVFAANLLIPTENEGELLRIRDLAGAISLAEKLEIPPGVVIGRLQRERLLPYSLGLGYRRKFELVGTPDGAW